MKNTDTTNTGDRFPKFVKAGDTALRCSSQSKGYYYRDAGNWEITAVFDPEGRLVVGKRQNRRLKHMIGMPLVECTEVEWRKDNLGYIRSVR